MASMAGFIPAFGLTIAVHMLRGRKPEEGGLLGASLIAFLILASMGILFAGDNLVALIDSAYATKQPLVNEQFRLPVLDSVTALFRPLTGVVFMANWVGAGGYLGWKAFLLLRENSWKRTARTDEVADNGG